MLFIKYNVHLSNMVFNVFIKKTGIIHIYKENVSKTPTKSKRKKKLVKKKPKEGRKKNRRDDDEEDEEEEEEEEERKEDINLS